MYIVHAVIIVGKKSLYYNEAIGLHAQLGRGARFADFA